MRKQCLEVEQNAAKMRPNESNISNIGADAAGVFPLGEALLEFQHAPQVVFHLLPTPISSGTKRAHSPDDDSGPKLKKDPKGRKRDKKEKDPPKKSGGDRVKVPEALRGYSGMNESKMRVCYNYNLPHGCSNSTHEKDGHTRCVKGCHECVKWRLPEEVTGWGHYIFTSDKSSLRGDFLWPGKFVKTTACKTFSGDFSRSHCCQGGDNFSDRHYKSQPTQSVGYPFEFGLHNLCAFCATMWNCQCGKKHSARTATSQVLSFFNGVATPNIRPEDTGEVGKPVVPVDGRYNTQTGRKAGCMECGKSSILTDVDH